MERKLLVKGSVIIFAAVMCIFLLEALLQIRINDRLRLQVLYIAAEDIQPRTLVDESDLIEVQIPRAYVPDHVIVNPEDIIGKYTDIQGMIPAGSYFYESMLEEADTIADEPGLLLKEGQVSLNLQIEQAELSSLQAGQRIDLYFYKDDISDILFRNVRVTAVKDHEGKSISDPQSTGIPFSIDLAVSQEDAEILVNALAQCTCKILFSSDTYRTDLEAELAEESKIPAYING